MTNSLKPLSVALLISTLVLTNCPFAARAQGQGFARSDRLEKLTRDVVSAAVERFGKEGLTADRIALTVIDLNDRERPAWASHRGQEMIYPASVVKLFYLAAAHHLMESRALRQTPELDRALRDMIVDSSNDATHQVVDVITGTTGGPELDESALREWLDKRNGVNRHFASLGYEKINVNQKTWCEGPYGRERQGLGPNYENRNKLTTEATARLVHEIVSGRAVSKVRARAMMDLLKRDPAAKTSDPDSQDMGFASGGLPRGSQYYAKAGWTSSARHDAAYVRLPGGSEYIMVVFTVDNSRQPGIIPFVSRMIAEDFSRTPARPR
ncbi:MAG TPA: serine hydrolase [Blastocatellia bacterium]|nr:serine hydrolase [Blastocatellia bacterium]